MESQTLLGLKLQSTEQLEISGEGMEFPEARKSQTGWASALPIAFADNQMTWAQESPPQGCQVQTLGEHKNRAEILVSVCCRLNPVKLLPMTTKPLTSELSRMQYCCELLPSVQFATCKKTKKQNNRKWDPYSGSKAVNSNWFRVERDVGFSRNFFTSCF